MRHNQAYESDMAFAHVLADTARTLSLARFRGPLQIDTKADGTIVTSADIEIEDELRKLIAQEQPLDSVLAEERGRTGNSERRWILDAIDGTQSFARGEELWGTLIALEVRGQVVLGVCDQPPLDRRSWAARGTGAYVSHGGSEPEALSVSEADSLRGARSFVPPPERAPNESLLSMGSELCKFTNRLPLSDHPALDVASGRTEFAVFFAGGPWDLAAPGIVVEEAGGKFTNLAGESDIYSGNAVFSNGRIHEAVMRIARGQRGAV